MAADRRRNDVQAGEEWKREEARRPRKSGSNYDRGGDRARDLARVLNQWNPLQRDGEEEWRPLSNGTVSERIQQHLGGKRYWPNDVQRTYNAERAMYHLQPKVVEAYCVALERTSDDDLTEAFYAAELKPPVVTKQALKLAIAASRGGARSHVA